jgi:hypothetical protein
MLGNDRCTVDRSRAKRVKLNGIEWAAGAEIRKTNVKANDTRDRSMMILLAKQGVVFAKINAFAAEIFGRNGRISSHAATQASIP